MSWWIRKPEQRVNWVLDPLVAVGPLRFGMTPEQVHAALDGKMPGITQDNECRLSWEHFTELGLATIYGPGPGLVAVAINALSGPLIRVRDIELIGRVPSETSAELHELARREGLAVGVNWSGDPEVAAWGISMGTAQDWGRTAEGYAERRDTLLTDALFLCAELAEDPYRTEPVIRWRDVRERQPNPGAWPVTPDAERPRWAWTPLQSVGPLRFGMIPSQVSAILDGETPAASVGHFPWPIGKEHGQWYLSEERFDQAGLTAHYWYRTGRPTLAAVTVCGRKGPQVSYDGLELIGKTVSTIDAALLHRAEKDDTLLSMGCTGDIGPEGLNMHVRSTRAGDVVISEARFCAEEWEDHG